MSARTIASTPFFCDRLPLRIKVAADRMEEPICANRRQLWGTFVPAYSAIDAQLIELWPHGPVFGDPITAQAYQRRHPADLRTVLMCLTASPTREQQEVHATD